MSERDELDQVRRATEKAKQQVQAQAPVVRELVRALTKRAEQNHFAELLQFHARRAE